MMAPAMKTRPDEPLAYRELARRGAAVSQQLGAASLPRWAAQTARDASVQTDLAFSLDDDGLVWVRGRYKASATMQCQRCLETLHGEYGGTVALCLIDDEARAQALAEAWDVMLVAADSVTVAEILEDELLLGLPDRLCVEEPCPRRPAMAYPAVAAEQVPNPFAVLGKLKVD